jgi:hypothetical protein
MKTRPQLRASACPRERICGPADVQATLGDAEQILAQASLAIDDAYLDPDEVMSPLPALCTSS